MVTHHHENDPRVALAVFLSLAVLLLLLWAVTLAWRAAARRRLAERMAAQDWYRTLVRSHLRHGGFEERDPACPLCQLRTRWDPEVRVLVERVGA